jgi:hypothetical protein
LSEQGATSESLDLTTATLEVLACIALNRPISQAEIDRLFDVDKRGLVVKPRDLKLVEEFREHKNLDASPSGEWGHLVADPWNAGSFNPESESTMRLEHPLFYALSSHHPIGFAPGI